MSYKPPQSLTLDGDGKGGLKVKPIGMTVASSLKGDIRQSLDTFKTVFA